MVKSLGDRIKDLRRQRGLTLQAVADQLGLTPAAISHWENGRIEPKENKLEALARILNVTPAALKGSKAALVGQRTPMAEIDSILADTKHRIAAQIGCAPQDVELVWRLKDRVS